MRFTQADIQDMADRICAILIAHGAHSTATSALDGMGEITLRDGLVAAAAAAGARTNRAWEYKREHAPTGWKASVDLVLFRTKQAGTRVIVGGVELKWWRRFDRANATNRRRDLVKDLIRASALHGLVEEFAFVALLSTEASWASTTSTNGADASIAAMLRNVHHVQKWNLARLVSAPAVKAAIKDLRGTGVPMPNIIHSKLLSSADLQVAGNRTVSARVWSIKKPQRSHYLSEPEIAQLVQ